MGPTKLNALSLALVMGFFPSYAIPSDFMTYCRCETSRR